MRHHRTFAWAAALLLPLCGIASAQPCSQFTVRGTWGFQGRGTAMISLPGVSTPVPTPFVALGTLNVDYQGRYTAHGTASGGGQIQEADWSGSIQVNPDCTGTDTYTYGSVEAADRIVIYDNGKEMRLMPTKFFAGPAAAVYYARRISWGEPNCTSDMIRGVYGETADGTALMLLPGQPQPVPMPFSAVFLETYQASGSGTAVGTASLGGTILDVQFPKMSWVVNSDCTATLTWTNVIAGQTYSGVNKYIVLNHGDELIGMDVKDSASLPIVLSNAKRISMQ